MNTTPLPSPFSRQRGAATLFITVMLVMLASLMGLYTSRSMLYDQKDSNNQYWATQVHEVAQSGVEYALAWLQYTYGASAPAGATDFWENASTAACPEGISGPQWQCFDLSGETGVGVDNYGVTVKLARNIVDSPNVTLISSVATQDDNNSLAEVSQKSYIPTIGSTPTGTVTGANAPIVLNGCSTNITGQPDVCPQNASGSPCSGNGSGVGTAMHTLYVPDTNGDGVISQAETNACLDLGHLDIHGGARTAASSTATPAPVAGASCNDAAWKEIFGTTTKAQMQAWSAMQEAAGLDENSTPKRSVYWIDSTSNWHESLGDASHSVILVFSETACAGGCPKINGNPTIYGTVYLDTQCDGTRTNGWGGATIYGTVAIESGMTKLNANTNIIYNGRSGGAFPDPLPPTFDGSAIQRVPGSWTDL